MMADGPQNLRLPPVHEPLMVTWERRVEDLLEEVTAERDFLREMLRLALAQSTGKERDK